MGQHPVYVYRCARCSLCFCRVCSTVSAHELFNKVIAHIRQVQPHGPLPRHPFHLLYDMLYHVDFVFGAASAPFALARRPPPAWWRQSGAAYPCLRMILYQYGPCRESHGALLPCKNPALLRAFHLRLVPFSRRGSSARRSPRFCWRKWAPPDTPSACSSFFTSMLLPLAVTSSIIFSAITIGNIQLNQLQRQIQISLYVCGVHNIDNRIRFFLDKKIPRYHLFCSYRAKGNKCRAGPPPWQRFA